MGRQRGWVQGWGRQSCSERQETGQTPVWSSLALQEEKAEKEKERYELSIIYLFNQVHLKWQYIAQFIFSKCKK